MLRPKRERERARRKGRGRKNEKKRRVEVYYKALEKGEVFFTYRWSFLLIVELLDLQSVEVLLRHTFPPQAKKLNCKQKKLEL